MKFTGREKVFNVKEFGNGHCRFGIKINTKRQDGTYSEGKFVNGVAFNQVLESGAVYELAGFIEDNEYNGNTELVFKVQTATKYSSQSAHQQAQKPQHKPMPQNNAPIIDIDDEQIPF